MKTQRFDVYDDRGFVALSIWLTHDKTNCECGDSCWQIVTPNDDVHWTQQNRVNVMPISAIHHLSIYTQFAHIYSTIMPTRVDKVIFGEYGIDSDGEEDVLYANDIGPALTFFRDCVFDVVRLDDAYVFWINYIEKFACNTIVDRCNGANTYVFNFDHISCRCLEIDVRDHPLQTLCSRCMSCIDNGHNSTLLDIYLCVDETKHPYATDMIRHNRRAYYNTLVALCMLFLKRANVPTHLIHPEDIRQDYDELYVCSDDNTEKVLTDEDITARKLRGELDAFSGEYSLAPYQHVLTYAFIDEFIEMFTNRTYLSITVPGCKYIIHEMNSDNGFYDLVCAEDDSPTKYSAHIAMFMDTAVHVTVRFYEK